MAIFTGTAGADLVLDAINATSDEVLGLEGNDTLLGATDDVLNGGAGDDVLGAVVHASSPVNMTVLGGSGFDYFLLANPADNNFVADLNLGTVTATSGGIAVSVSLSGVEGVRGTEGDDHFVGNGADNLFEMVSGNDIASGGAGFDVASVSLTLSNFWNGPGVVADLAAGTLGFYYGVSSLTSIEGVAGEAFDDRLRGNDLDNRFWPGLGEDQIVGRLGLDTVSYDTMNRYFFDYQGQLAHEVLGGVAVNLTLGRALKPDGSVDVLVGVERVLGSLGEDTIRGSAAADTLMGGGGADRLYGGGGNDILLGFHDGVLVYGTHGDDGADTLDGGFGLDSLAGGAGDDSLIGGASADVLEGDGGDDNLRGDAGSDTLDGGAGYDRAVYRFDEASLATGVAFSAALVGSADELLFRDGRGGQDMLRSIEAVKLIGTGFADTLTGSPGNDFIGGAGGDDVLRGGAGFDVLVFDEAPGAVQADLSLQRASGAQGSDTLSGFEGLSGGAYGDDLRGNPGGNLLYGMAGNDTLAGLGGDDEMRGGEGADVLDGGFGNDLLMGEGGRDRLQGGGGNDRLWGLAGADTLSGGLGNDEFYFSEAPDPGGTFDTIRDFVVGQDKMFLFGPAFAESGADGVLADAAFTTGTAATTAEQRLIFDDSTGQLFYDADGNGYQPQVLVAVVSVSSGTLSASDVVIFS